MKFRSRPIFGMLALALPAATAASCFSDHVTGPATDHVEIRLAVTGGIAGVDYSFVIDGAEGVVRGLTCNRGCGFEPGEVLVPISSFQLRDLVERFTRLGFLGLDGTDYGSVCCDSFAYTIEYHEGRNRAIVRGSAGALPEPLLQLTDRIHALGSGVVAAIVAHDTDPARWPRDPMTLDGVIIDGTTLTARLGWSGGCADHSVDLVAWGGFLESNPVQIRTFLAHDSRYDPCDALVRASRTFDLAPIRQSWRDAYGSDHGTIVLRLADPGTGLDRTFTWHF